MLSGYKTYITAVVGIVTAVGAYLAGDVSLGDTLQIIFTAGIGAFLRAGVSSAGK
jgi:type IV secretory pathway VirB2 component (pilin)